MNSGPKKAERSICGELSRAILDRERAAILVCDAKGTVVTAGASARELCGGDPTGRPFESLFALSRNDGSCFSVSPALRGESQRLVEVALERKADGLRFTLLLDAKPLWGDGDVVTGCVIALTDVTQVAAMESDLRDSEARLRRTIENLPGIVYRLDLRDNAAMTFFNSVHERLTGYRTEELYHGEVCSIDPLIVAEDREQVLDEVERALRDNKPFKVTYRLRRKDGEIRHFTEQGNPVPGEDGSPRFIYGVIFDVTDQKKVEIEREDLLDETRRSRDDLGREVRDRIAEVEEVNRRLQTEIANRARLEENLRQKAKMEALGTMAGAIAHDLNNVLGPVLVNAEMALLEVPETGPARDHLTTVLRAGRRGREIIAQILGFSRPRQPACRDIEIGPIVRECLQFVEATLPENIEVRTDVSAGEARVCADPTQVHQVLLNLISNAASAMEKGGGVLGVRLGNVDVGEDAAALNPDLKPGPYLELAVSDSGSGMTREVMTRMFDPFFTTKEPGRGAGIGMAIVRRIVADQGGAIDVSSEPGRGTVVRVFIPRHADRAEG
jgi:PAS domain S-box-containing protein